MFKCKYCENDHEKIQECMWNELQRRILDYMLFEFSFDGLGFFDNDIEEIHIT